MKRPLAFVGIAAIAVLLYLQFAPTESSVTVTDARAMPVGGSETMFMVSLTMQNDGPAVVLTGVTSSSGGQASIMNPGDDGPLVIPAGGTGQFAMDGAHIMLMAPDRDFEEGTLQSIALAFDDGSTVAVRVLRPEMNDGMGMMQHGMSQAVEVSPAPTLTIVPPKAVSADGFDIQLQLENFAFVVAADDADHVPNQGHAHVYLNGLKLGRLYEDQLSLGGLKSGDYQLRVSLNSNDHRPYAAAGQPIEAVFAFQVP